MGITEGLFRKYPIDFHLNTDQNAITQIRSVFRLAKLFQSLLRIIVLLHELTFTSGTLWFYSGRHVTALFQAPLIPLAYLHCGQNLSRGLRLKHFNACKWVQNISLSTFGSLLIPLRAALIGEKSTWTQPSTHCLVYCTVEAKDYPTSHMLPFHRSKITRWPMTKQHKQDG